INFVTTTTMATIKCIFILLCLISTFFARTRIGRRCYHKQKQTVGVCTLSINCSSAFEDFISGILPQKCGFSRNLLCCVEKKVGEKSREMCKKYEDLGFIKEKPPTLAYDDELVRSSICPYDEDGLPIIYGGEEAKAGEFPHMALIGYGINEKKWKCGGSLISDRYVLSAGHCLSDKEFGPAAIVRLGDLNYTNPNDDIYVQEIPIIKTHKYPYYKYPVTYHDIAIFELEYPTNLSIYVKPICLYNEEKIPPGQVLAVGWGDTEKAEKGENDMLMKVGLDVIDEKTCSKTFGKNVRAFPKGLDDHTQVCAGSTKEAKDTCQGDSGGPIQIRNKEVACSYYILGITSHGKGCGFKLPSVYIRIYPYIQWIESIIYEK
ncbi:Trypsin, partial [Oryctes borbonicus]